MDWNRFKDSSKYRTSVSDKERLKVEIPCGLHPPDNRVQFPDDLVIMISEFLGALTERERYIIVHRYGLMSEEFMTCRELAETFNLSNARIGQIENSVLRKLRRMACKQRREIKQFET